jgi:hypothetical protein
VATKLKDRIGVGTATVGAGTVALGAPLPAEATLNRAGWKDFSAAGVADGQVVRYLLLDANGAWEYGLGTYSSTGGPIPMTFSDPMFVGMTESVSTVTLSSGQNLANRSIVENSGNSTIVCLGNNSVTLCRVNSRECVRLTTGNVTMDRCYFEATGVPSDHADTIQAFSPGATGGVITVTNSHIRAHNNDATAGYFTADSWGGTIVVRNCIFQGGPYGFRCHADAGCHINISFEDVFFVGPFAFDHTFISGVGGGTISIQKWSNVCNATIVGGAIVPGAAIPSPFPLFPDASNTGPTAGTVFTDFNGSFLTTANGQVVEKRRIIGGPLDIRHSNVTVRDCIIESQDLTGIRTTGAGPFTGCLIERCKISGISGSTIGISPDACTGIEIRFCDISSFENGIAIAANAMNIHDNYIHGLIGGSGAHIDGIQGTGGFTSLTINHNTIESWDTSCIILQNEGAAFSGVVITNNRLLVDQALGGAYVVLIGRKLGLPGAVSNITVTGNRMRKGPGVGVYGFITNDVTSVTWSGNVDDVTGAAIPTYNTGPPS